MLYWLYIMLHQVCFMAKITFTAYLDFWFRHLPYPERVVACAKLGIPAVEVWAWREKPIAEIAAACTAFGVIFNDTFDAQGGSLVDATQHPRCLNAWAESLEMAQQHGIKRLFMFSNQINADGWADRLSGNLSAAQQYANLLDGAAAVMALVEKTDVEVWFEALNTFDLHGDILVHSHELAADVVRRIGHPQLRLAFDCYHQQRTAGNLIHGLHAHHGLYNTVHFGDVPTRAEPGTGEINFANLVKVLAKLKFEGSIGLEFVPTDETTAWQAIQHLCGPLL
jgi:hydroxypyruvate isomerase